MKLTPEQIAEIKGRCNAATEGPWRVTTSDGRKNIAIESASVVKTDTPERMVSSVHITAWKQDGRNAKPTAEFIAHSRTDIPTLLAHIEAVETERDALRAAVEQVAIDIMNNHSLDGPANVSALMLIRDALETQKSESEPK